MKRLITLLVLLLIIALALWIYFRFGFTNRDVADTVVREGDSIRARVDERCDALDRKLDRIEAKLDRLIEMATPKLPDGMERAQ